MSPNSYSRNCRWCGRRIQLRKMPHGQWVAYEGYDIQHKCETVPGRRSAGRTSEPGTRHDPGFIDFDLPGNATSGSNVSDPDSSVHRSRGSSRARVPVKGPANQWKVVLFWIIVLAVLFAVCS